VRFQGLTVVPMRLLVSNVTPCSSLDGDGGNTFLQNVGTYVSNYIGESNENRKTEIKIQNIAPLSYKLVGMLPLL
jgi:hypothetical protein